MFASNLNETKNGRFPLPHDYTRPNTESNVLRLGRVHRQLSPP